MQNWFAKRFDVMAMNSAMILGTLVVVVVLVVGWNCGLFPYDRLLPVLLWSAVASVIAVFLIVDNWILARQAIRIGRSYMKDLDDKQDIREALRL